MEKLDLHKLNDEHVKSLINELKYPTTHIDENALKHWWLVELTKDKK